LRGLSTLLAEPFGLFAEPFRLPAESFRLLAQPFFNKNERVRKGDEAFFSENVLQSLKGKSLSLQAKSFVQEDKWLIREGKYERRQVGRGRLSFPEESEK
jgi:hypothetical protein